MMVNLNNCASTRRLGSKCLQLVMEPMLALEDVFAPVFFGMDDMRSPTSYSEPD